jgi:hypothetical protein
MKVATSVKLFRAEADLRIAARELHGDYCREVGLVACRCCKTVGVAWISDLDDDDEPEPVPGPCPECSGRGWVVGWREMVVPHESRVMGARR